MFCQRIGTVAIVALLAVACGGTPAVAPSNSGGEDGTKAAQNKLVLTIATGESNPEEALTYAKAVAEESGGSIEVKVDNKSVAHPPTYEAEVIKYVAGGKAQLGFTAARAFDTVGVSSFVGLNAPFLIDSYELEAQVLAADWAKELLGGTRSAGVVGIGYLQGPMRRPLGLTRKLVDLADYNGARIGIRPSALTEMTIKALGAVPVEFQPGDVTGLDGMEVHLSLVRDAYDDVTNTLTGNVIFWSRPGVIFANNAAFDALSADQQDILRRAGVRALATSVEMIGTRAAVLPDEVCEQGVPMIDASEEAIAELRAAVQPVYDEIEKDPGTRATIDAIEALRASSGAVPADVKCNVAASTPPPSVAPVDSPIVGTYTTSYTRAELEASPLLYDSGEVNDENWGDLTITFNADGTVTFSGSNPFGSDSTTGTYSVTDDHFEVAFHEGGNKGETFSGRWSLFRDTLTFERVGDEELPTAYVIKPWKRVP